MDQDGYTEISLVDLFAFFVKKFSVILIGSLVGMVLFLSFHLVSSYSAKKTEAFEKSLSQYKVEYSSLENTISSLNLKLDEINKIESISPFLSGGQVYVSRVFIAVDSDLTSDSDGMLSIVGQEISSFWDSLDLASIVGSNIDSDALKASIIFERAGQSISIRVYNEDKAKAERSAISIVDAVVSYIETRNHLSIGSKTIATSVASKNEIATIRDHFMSDKTDLLKSIYDTETKLDALEKNIPRKMHPLKNAVFGLLIGGIVVAIVLGIAFALHYPVTCSFMVEKVLGIHFLGALFCDNSFFSKSARRIVAERTFKGYEDSVAFLKSSFTTKAFTGFGKKQRIALISSVNDSKVEKVASDIRCLLNDEGYETTFIGNSSENPLAIKTIEDSDAVIFLERQWVSRLLLLSMNKKLVSKMEKTVHGFIIC